jgi:hypothetical protein
MTSTPVTPLLEPDELQSVATRALGSRVSDMVPLRVQADGAAYRAQAGATTVIVKQMRAGEGAARERSFLEVAREHELAGVVRLLGASDDHPVVVLEDAGDGTSLADAFLGNDPKRASTMLDSWVDAVAGLQIASADHAANFADQLTRHGTGEFALDATPAYVDNLVVRLAPACARIGLELPDDVVLELHAAANALAVTRDSPAGLVPGDTCPDNSAELGAKVVLFDFEGAQFRHIAWEVAYLSAPWPTCWCSWALPEPIAAAATDRWRTLLASIHPYASTEAFDVDLDHATTVWSAQRLAHQLEMALDGTERPRTIEGVAPSARAIVLHRLASLAADPFDSHPRTARLAAGLRKRCIDEFGEHALLVAPAWR